MGRDASHPRRRLSDPMRDPEAPRRPPSHAIPTDDHPTTRWSLPSDSSVPFLDLAHRVPPTVSSLALDRELEMDLEASDNTLRRHEEAALRVSEHQNPFGASRLQPFHEMSEHAIARAIELCRARLASRNKPLSADAQAATKTKPPTRAQEDAQWKLVKEHADIRVYRHVKRRGKTTAMMAQGMVRGSLAEIMDGLYAETTKEARVLYPLLSGSFLDVAVLHVDSYRTAQHPFQFAGVTWMAFETPRGGYGMCKDRDFVCFKKMGLLKDPESSAGDDIGFLTILSVDQRDASTGNSDSSAHFSSPSSPAEYVRGFLSLTAFFKKLPNGLVSMFVSGDFNARGRLAMRLADHMFADLVFALGNAATCGQAKSLAMLLQSITGGQMPPNGVGGGLLTASVSGSHVSHLLPLISDKHRDRCGVCAKSLWRVIKRPEFCRSCWTRTCRNCHVTMPIYCADFHRAHDEDGFGTNGPTKRKYKRLPRPCKETFCLKCVCSVLPNGIKMNAKLLQQTAKKRKYHKKHGGGGSISLGTDASLLRRGMGRTAASARHVPSVIPSFESHSSHRNGNGKSGGSIGGGSSRNGREPGKLYVQISRPHHMRSRGGTPSNGGNGASGPDSVARAPPLRVPYHHRFDDQSSISVLSSVESEKLQRQRLSLNKVNAKQLSSIATTPQRPPSDTVSLKQPSSMLEVIEHFQQTQKTAALSADYSEPLNDYMDDDGGLTYNSYTSLSGDVAIYPSDRSQSAVNSSAPTSRKLQLRVNLTPRKRSRRSSTASSSLGGYSQTSSKRTNAASSTRQSPQLSSHPAPFDDAYYNLALQRYLEHRRSSLRTMSSTMSGNPFESLDKAAAEATALAIASSSERGKIGGYAAVASTSMSTSSGSIRGPVGRDAHKLRILRDLEPFPRTASFLDRPLTPSGVSLSSLSSWDSSSSSGTSGSVAEEAARSGRVDYPEHKRSKREWTPRAY